MFENRKIKHAPLVGKDCFLAKYKGTEVARKFGRRFRAKNHKLPGEWRKIMNKKTWKTFSEDSFRKDIAAWVWMQEGHPAFAPTQGITIESALFSKLWQPRMVVRSKGNNTLYASLGNYAWAAMAWGMRVFSTEADAWIFQLNPTGRAEFIHVTDPSTWEVLPYEAHRGAAGADCLVLRRVLRAMQYT